MTASQVDLSVLGLSGLSSEASVVYTWPHALCAACAANRGWPLPLELADAVFCSSADVYYLTRAVAQSRPVRMVGTCICIHARLLVQELQSWSAVAQKPIPASAVGRVAGEIQEQLAMVPAVQ